jgi:hypothetical protein
MVSIKPQHFKQRLWRFINQSVMKILVEIDCDDLQELYGHLSEMKASVFKLMKKRFKPTDSLPIGFVIENDNCYGSHYAIVKEL